MSNGGASKNVVYVDFCGCPKYYISSSTPAVKTCIIEHWSRLKNGVLNAPMVEHCSAAQNHFEDLKFFVIYKYENKGFNRQDVKKVLLCREHFWIFKLHTMAPDGMNQGMDLLCHV